MLVLAATVALNFYLFAIIPKGFFPQQDTGTLVGHLRADQSISFQAMAQKLRSGQAIVQPIRRCRTWSASPAAAAAARAAAAPPTPPTCSSA